MGNSLYVESSWCLAPGGFTVTGHMAVKSHVGCGEHENTFYVYDGLLVLFISCWVRRCYPLKDKWWARDSQPFVTPGQLLVKTSSFPTTTLLNICQQIHGITKWWQQQYMLYTPTTQWAQQWEKWWWVWVRGIWRLGVTLKTSPLTVTASEGTLAC